MNRLMHSVNNHLQGAQFFMLKWIRSKLVFHNSDVNNLELSENDLGLKFSKKRLILS